MKKNKSEKFPFTLDTELEMMPDDEFEALLKKLDSGSHSINLNPKPLFQQLAETPACKCGSRQFVKVSKPGEEEKYQCEHCGLILDKKSFEKLVSKEARRHGKK